MMKDGQPMTAPTLEAPPANVAPALEWKLWIYTNYECNIRCTYCVARSSP